MPFLPLTVEEMHQYGWERPDFVYVIGDAYIDHPSFGPAIISRVLENFGYKVCIISQPDIQKNADFKRFGLPRLAFLVSSGNIDSMVNHYTVSKRRRKKDYYTPGAVMGKRPDRALIRYSSKLRELYPHATIIIGGIEASLRRLNHYDYWDNSVRRSILLDSKADLLLYGMGEKTIVQVADALDSGLAVQDLIYLRNTVWKTKDQTLLPSHHVLLPSYDAVLADKKIMFGRFKFNIGIPMLLPDKLWWSPTETALSFKIRRNFRFLPKKWMPPMRFPTCADATRSSNNKVMSRRLTR